MNFDFSDDEKLVRDQTARFLADRCGTDVVRQVLEGKAVYADDVWRGLIEMGLTATTIPETYDGVDAGYLSLCLVAEQLGAHVAPTPFATSVYLATEAIKQFGDDAQKSRWLPKFASGQVIGTCAVVEGTTEVTPQSIQAKVTRNKLTGKKLIVANGGIADLAVVLARDSRGLNLYLADLNDPSVSRTALETVDPTSNSASIEFNATRVKRLGAAGTGWDALATVYDRAAVLVAFEQLGGAQAALDMAVGYAKERFAFGRPIGSFQALKHMMADMYVALKLAESNCYYAAWALASDAPDLPLAAATARVSATQAYQLCSRDNIQVHGGMGFTWEFDCHLHYRRSNYLALLLGGLNVWENKLVNALTTAAA